MRWTLIASGEQRDRLTGKSVSLLIHLSSPFCKNIPLNSSGKSNLELAPSCPTKGRLEIVADAGQDAVDASGAMDEGAILRTAKSCGPGSPTLESSS